MSIFCILIWNSRELQNLFKIFLSFRICVAFLVLSKLCSQHVLISENTKSRHTEIWGGSSCAVKKLLNNHGFLEFCKKRKSRVLLGCSFKPPSFYISWIFNKYEDKLYKMFLVRSIPIMFTFCEEANELNLYSTIY